jgi:hypothetical protein
MVEFKQWMIISIGQLILNYKKEYYRFSKKQINISDKKKDHKLIR